MSPEHRLAHALLMGMVSVVGVLGNTATLFAIAFHRPLRNATGAFMANLAVADILQCVFGLPFIIAATVKDKWIFGRVMCVITGATNSLFCITSMLTLSAVSFDRFLAIVHPLRYEDLMRTNRVRLGILSIWAQSAFFALLPVIGWSRYTYLPYEFICTVQWELDLAYTFMATGLCFGVPAVVTTVCHFRIMRTACQHARSHPTMPLGEIRVAVADPTSPEAASNRAEAASNRADQHSVIAWVTEERKRDGVRKDEQRSAANATRRKELKVGLMVLLVNCAFLFCWVPHMVGIFCLALTGGSCPWPSQYFVITTNLAMLNSAVNPVIYSMTNRNYRQAFFRFFCRRCDAARATGPHTS